MHPVTSNHPSLDPMIGEHNFQRLIKELDRLEMVSVESVAVDAYRHAGDLLRMMWKAAVIATNAANIEIAESPNVDDEATAIRRRLELMLYEAKAAANASPSGEAGKEIARMESIAEVIADLEAQDLVPNLAELLYRFVDSDLDE